MIERNRDRLEQRAAVRRAPVTLALAAVLALGLSACGSKPPRGDDARGASTGGSKGGIATVPATRGGGYYKDDGPDDVVPANLDAIPDAVPRIEAFHAPALRPYTVMGQNFVPQTELRASRERGHASWYGRRFHGNPTSIGEPYDMYAMTAAHPTLPLPSYARVTNLGNGRSVVVRVNDRGPFLRGRIMDLSYAAAHRLGYINTGSAEVVVEPITHEQIRLAGRGQNAVYAAAPMPVAAPPQVVPPAVPSDGPVAVTQVALPPPARPIAAAPVPQVPGSGVFLQLGAFETQANAAGLFGRARNELVAFADRLHLFDDGGRYRLQVGPFASAEEARAEAGRIGAILNLQPFVVTR